MISMSKARARAATRPPIRPRPTMPSVFSASSTPFHLLRSHRPSTRAAWACAMLRAWANNIAIVCSAAVIAFENGAFATSTLRSVAASTSTLSRPIPARPTIFKSVPAESSSALTVVADRMMIACAPTIAAARPASSSPIWTSTSCPASRNRSKPLSEISSDTSTRAMPGIYSAGRPLHRETRHQWSSFGDHTHLVPP